MKVFTVVALALVATYTFLLPKYFHSQIHQAIVPQIGTGKQITYNSHHHQSVIKGEDYSLTITSAAGLNPLDYQVDVKYQKDSYPNALVFKIQPIIGMHELGVKFQLEDQNIENETIKFKCLNTSLEFKTPLSKVAIKNWRDKTYFLTNGKIEFLADELSLSEGGNKFLIRKVNAVLDLTSTNTNKLIITKNFGYKKMEVFHNGKKTVTLDATNTIVLNSINKSGIMQGFAEMNQTDDHGMEVPFMVKVMGAMGRAKHFVNFPFNIKLNSKSHSSEGEFLVDGNIDMNELNIQKLDDFLKADVKMTFPKPFLEETAMNFVVDHVVNALQNAFVSPGFSDPATQQMSIASKEIAQKNREKLLEAVRSILADTSSGESKIQTLMKDLIQQKLIEPSNNGYSLNLRMQGMDIQIGELPLERTYALLMKIDVTQQLLAKGFVLKSSPDMQGMRMPSSLPVLPGASPFGR